MGCEAKQPVSGTARKISHSCPDTLTLVALISRACERGALYLKKLPSMFQQKVATNEFGVMTLNGGLMRTKGSWQSTSITSPSISISVRFTCGSTRLGSTLTTWLE